MNYVTAWLILSLAGLLLAFAGLVDARRDLEVLRTIPTANGRHLIARHQLIRYILRIVTFGIFAGAALAPPLVAPLLILANVALVLTTLSDWLTGAYLRRGVRAELDAESRRLERTSQ